MSGRIIASGGDGDGLAPKPVGGGTNPALNAGEPIAGEPIAAETVRATGAGFGPGGTGGGSGAGGGGSQGFGGSGPGGSGSGGSGSGGSGEGIAERYVDEELRKAKSSLLRTQIGSVLAVLVLGGYMLYITQRFRASLEPHEAATIAQGLVSQKLDQQGGELAEYVKKEVPNYIRQAPDYALKELPNFRTGIQGRVDTEIKTYAKSSSERLGGEVDKFLEANKEGVGEMLKNGNDPAAAAKINAGLKEVFVKYLDEPIPGPNGAPGESAKAKLDGALDILTKVEARMKRLATAKDLTVAEQNAKRAIAVLLKTVEEKRVEEGRTEAIAPAAIEGARARVGEAVTNAAETAGNAPSSGAANGAANAPSGGAAGGAGKR